MADFWRAEVPIPDWLRRAMLPVLSAAVAGVGIWFLDEKITGPFFTGFRMLADLHCPPEHLGWAGRFIDAACGTGNTTAGIERYVFLNVVAMPAIAYACVVATWIAGVRSAGWIAGGTAALLTALSPLLFVLSHAITPASLMPFAVAATLVVAECASRSGHPSVQRSAWLMATLCGAVLVTGLDTRAGVVGTVALVHALWRGARPNARAWIATGAAALALLGAYAPTSDYSTAVVRAGVRALPLDVIGYGFPDTWRSLPFFGDYFGFGLVALLIAGAWTARASIIPFAIAAVFAQSALLALSPWSATSAVSLTYAIVIVSLAVGAVTQRLASHPPRALAALLPALAAVAFIVTFQTLEILKNYDPVDRDPGGAFAFAPGSEARLYHLRGRADIAKVYSNDDGLWSTTSSIDRASVYKPASSPVIVDHAVVLSEYRTLVYGYSVRSADGRWNGVATANELWLEPPIGGCVRPLDGYGMRLYDRAVVPFRAPDVGEISIGPFKVLDARDAPWLPELHVETLGSASARKTGWIYVQTLDLWDPKSPSRATDFQC